MRNSVRGWIAMIVKTAFVMIFVDMIFIDMIFAALASAQYPPAQTQSLDSAHGLVLTLSQNENADQTPTLLTLNHSKIAWPSTRRLPASR